MTVMWLLAAVCAFVVTAVLCGEAADGIPQKLYYMNPNRIEIPGSEVCAGNAVLFGDENAETLYPKKELQKLDISCRGKIPAEEIVNLQAYGRLIRQWKWMFLLAAAVPVVILCLIRAAGAWTAAYESFCRDTGETGKLLFKGAAIAAAVFGVWYLLLGQLDIPQQFYAEETIGNPGYYWNSIRNFYQSLRGQDANPYLRMVGEAGIRAGIGYGISFMCVFIGCVRLEK